MSLNMVPSPAAAFTVAAWDSLKDGDPSTVNLDPFLDDVGVVTIGWGRAVRALGVGTLLRGASGMEKAAKIYPSGITRDQAAQFLAEDLRTAAGGVNRAVQFAEQGQFDAFTSFAFNLGPDALAKSSLLRLHNGRTVAGRTPQPEAALDLWKRVRDRKLDRPSSILEGFVAFSFAGGTPLLGLFARRLAEHAVYGGEASSEANARAMAIRDFIRPRD